MPAGRQGGPASCGNRAVTTFCSKMSLTLWGAGEYILMNPVRAGLVDDPEDWPWSGWIDALDAPPGEKG